MPVVEATDKTPRTVVMDRSLSVYVHNDASMSVPRAGWLYDLNWSDDPSGDKMLAASVGESYRYLIMECTKEEAWLRIQKMRAAIRAHDKSDE